MVSDKLWELLCFSSKLHEIFEGMDLPERRKDLNKISNLRWLQRNLLIRNGNHPRAEEALVFIEHLIKSKRKQN